MAACADLVWSKTKLAHLTRRTIGRQLDPTPLICRIRAMVSHLKLLRNSLWMEAVNSWQLLSKATDRIWGCPKLSSKLSALKAWRQQTVSHTWKPRIARYQAHPPVRTTPKWCNLPAHWQEELTTKMLWMCTTRSWGRHSASKGKLGPLRNSYNSE